MQNSATGYEYSVRVDNSLDMLSIDSSEELRVKSYRVCTPSLKTTSCTISNSRAILKFEFNYIKHKAFRYRGLCISVHQCFIGNLRQFVLV